MNLRTRIILAMTALMVISLLVIGVVTVFFFKSQNDQYHRDRLVRKERAIKQEMMFYSKEVEAQEDMDVVMKDFEEEVLRLAFVHHMDINFYNTRGDVLIAARPDSITGTELPQRIPPIALEQLAMTDRIVLPEEGSSGHILSDYTVLRNDQGERIGILHLPYRREDSVDQNDLKGFLGSISLTYLFLFLAAVFFTVILSNSITRNLSLLSDRMRDVDFNKHNEPIEWRRDDEIGKLVKAYNNMLQKLEENREALARTEREGAWREMARQVAHEIKNPLTPIKLSVQHLMATSDFSAPVWQQKFQQTMAMIIQQTDSLTHIASEFSDFAKMPRQRLELVSVAQAIRDVLPLFAESGVAIETSLDEDAMVRIDADAFRRVIGNITRNAEQALAGISNPGISISAHVREGMIRITISDNGCGINEELKPKIFQPNFTTKTSGTGLGLAICKQIVEQAGGEISFESAVGSGTTFTLILPAAEREY